MPVYLRPIQPEDVPQIARADAASLTYRDADFDLEMVRPWVLTEERIFSFVRERNPRTRTVTVESQGELLDEEGNAVACNWVSGGFCYAEQPDLYGLHFLAMHPESDWSETVAEVAEFLREKARRSPKRPEVRLVLRDRDEAHLRFLLPAWRAQGFAFELWPNYFCADGEPACDGWLGVYRARKKSSVKTY